MAKHIETSLETFARREPTVAPVVLSAIVLSCLLVGLIFAVAAQNWLFIGVLSVSLLVMAVFAVSTYMQFRRHAAAADQMRVDWETAMPEIQRQNLNLEVFELSKILEVESGQISDLQSAYIVAEDLALRQIQQEENVPLMRHVTLGKAPFDAVLVKDDVISCIEVAFLVAPDLRHEKITAMMRKIDLVKKTFGEMQIRMNIRLMLVLVTQLTLEDEDILHSVMKTKLGAEAPVGIGVEIRFLDFESLQKIYVTD